MSAAALMARIDQARSGHQKAKEMLGETRDFPDVGEGLENAQNSIDGGGVLDDVGDWFDGVGNWFDDQWDKLTGNVETPPLPDPVDLGEADGELQGADGEGGLEPENPDGSNYYGRTSDEPVIDQGNEPTCAPVSAAMLLETFGIDADPERLAEQAGTTEVGTDMADLESAMRDNGVNARLQNQLSIDDLAEATADHPAIAYVDLERGAHAVVIDGITERNGEQMVAIRDPAGGRQYFTPVDEFEQQFNLSEDGGLAIVIR
jgi:hypothetical protein